MRKANFKTLLAVTLIVLAFLMAGVEKGYTQAGVAAFHDQELVGPPSGPQGDFFFVDAPQAEAILNAHHDALASLIAGLPQGSPAWLQTERALIYYRAIMVGLFEGKAVEEAFMDGISMFSSPKFIAANYSEKLGLREESMTMLAQ